MAESGGGLPAIAAGPRTTAALRVFLRDPGTPRDGLNIARAAAVPVHSVYQALAVLDRAGWIVAHGDRDGRASRTRYTMPPAGAAAALRQLHQPASGGGDGDGGQAPQVGCHAAAVLRVFLDDPYTPRDGWDVMQATGLPDTTVYPGHAPAGPGGLDRSRLRGGSS